MKDNKTSPATATATVSTKEAKPKMNKVNKKKTIVLISMIALLVTVGCLNYFMTFTPPGGSDGDIIAPPTFFVTYKQDREATRAQEIIYLDGIIASELSDAATVQLAQNKKLGLCDVMEQELIIEGLIKAKGFEDCIVTMSTNNVNIVVKAEELTLEQAAQILNIIVSETSYTAPDVIIIPYV